ncbi:MAG: endolytic transglycosylase MltG [Actinomycetota bacterium]|nr:endolytic transglycosylase MltG [Actinomycetota bacterium]
MARRGRDGGDRSAADREAARLERERKRAIREGRTPPESIPATDEPRMDPVGEVFAPEAVEPGPEPVAYEPEPPPYEPDPEPEPPVEEPAPDPEPPVEEPPVEEPVEPEPTAVSATATKAERRTVHLPRPQTGDAGGREPVTESHDRPSGILRARRDTRADYKAQPGAPGMPPHRSLGVHKRRRRLRRTVPLLVAALVAIGAGVFAFLLFQPMHGGGYGNVPVRVPPGSSATQIGKQLEKAKVVDSSFFFALRARIDGKRSKLRAGTFALKKSMPYGAALTALTTPPSSAPIVDVTLPEGPSRRELASKVKAAGVTGNYLKASARSSKLKPSTYGAPRATRSLEGFLYPDTYELRRAEATARNLVGKQLDAFKKAFGTIGLKTARRKRLSRYDVLIIASMIEREALVPKDRPLIAAVIYNRLKQGIPLGIDATLRYKLGNFSAPLKQSELKLDSAYNTRMRKGLPPTPIGNPGLASLKAAANPASVKYLYYVVKPCGKGAHSFSSSFRGFQQDVAAYDRKRKALGGKSPVTC